MVRMNPRPTIALRLMAGLLAPLGIGCQVATGVIVDLNADRDAVHRTARSPARMVEATGMKKRRIMTESRTRSVARF